MGILKTLLGIPDVGDVVEKTGSALDKLFTSKGEKLGHAEVMARIEQDPQKWQAQINMIGAGHRSAFVAGWRPFIGWVCGIGLFFIFLVNPILQWATGEPGPELPQDIILELVLALLGLGALRTIEKLNGASK